MWVVTACGVQCLVTGCRGSDAEQQAVSPGRGMLHFVQHPIVLPKKYKLNLNLNFFIEFSKSPGSCESLCITRSHRMEHGNRGKTVGD